MTSRTEGIALLSMYNDDEDDDDEEEEEERQPEPTRAAPEEMEVDDGNDDQKQPASRERTPQAIVARTPNVLDEGLDLKEVASSDAYLHTPSPPLQARDLFNFVSLKSTSPLPIPTDTAGHRRTSALGIVDYGHDDAAMSPEAEEGEIVAAGHAVLNTEHQNAHGILEEKIKNSVEISTPNLLASPSEPRNLPIVSSIEKARTIDATKKGNDVYEVGTEGSEKKHEDVDPLDKFLPPPPTLKCSQSLQDKISKFIALKKSGKRFNVEIRKLKEYRNPDFLQHAVTYQGINQTGTCFNKDVFDPQGYDPRDYYDQIEADMRREIEKREQERKRSPKIDFTTGGTHTNVVPPKPNVFPGVGVPAVYASGQQLLSGDVTSKDSRPNKKSKWDKVDNDSRNPLQSAGKDNISTASVHATFLSISGAGSGYTAFAEQKRKEADEKRSSERKFEKRT